MAGNGRGGERGRERLIHTGLWGVAWRDGRLRAPRESRRWPGARVRAAGTRPRAYWHEVEDRGGVGLGWLQCWAAQLGCR